MFASLCISLISTLIIETVLAVLAKIRDKESLSAIAWVNCLTNPVVVYLTNIALFYGNETISTVVLLILEVIVVPVEGFPFKRRIKKENLKPYLLSLYLNVSSFLIGVVIGLCAR